jgi:TonB family protein
MLDHLVESNKKGRRDVRGMVLGMVTSTTLQAALMVGAVYATVAAPHVAPLITGDSIILYPSDPEPQEQPQEDVVVAPLHPLPFGSQTLDLPTEILTEIPPVDPDFIFDPRNYTSKGVPGGVWDGDSSIAGPLESLTRLYESGVVDEEPELISCPVLEYPRMMRQASIEGQVLLRFIVETDGHVRKEHIEALSSSHRAFEEPAKAMISKCLFRAGRVRASAVRVLAEMPVVFSLVGR